jgi:hypothetical protein
MTESCSLLLNIIENKDDQSLPFLEGFGATVGRGSVLACRLEGAKAAKRGSWDWGRGSLTRVGTTGPRGGAARQGGGAAKTGGGAAWERTG